MKNKIYIFYALLISILLNSCKDRSYERDTEECKVKAYQLHGVGTIMVIDFERHQYLSNGHGLIHLESCICKRDTSNIK